MEKDKKYFRIVDICFQLAYIFCSGVFFYKEMLSWELSGDSRIAVLVVTALFLCVNVFFFFTQLLFDSIKWKKYIFIFHNLCLFGFTFFLEIQWSMDWNNGVKVWGETSPWIFYIPLFIIVSYLLYDDVLNRVTGSQNTTIIGKLLNQINNFLSNEEEK